MINLTVDNFESKIEEGSNLVFFWGPNCTKCHALKPRVEEVEEDYGNVSFYDVNIRDSRNLAKSEGVRTLPTIIFYENGVKKQVLTGNDANLDEILDQLDEID